MINVIDTIKAVNTSIPVIENQDIRGGFKTFSTISERNATSSLKLESGTIAFVIDTNSFYQWVGTWEIIEPSGTLIIPNSGKLSSGLYKSNVICEGTVQVETDSGPIIILGNLTANNLTLNDDIDWLGEDIVILGNAEIKQCNLFIINNTIRIKGNLSFNDCIILSSDSSIIVEGNVIGNSNDSELKLPFCELICRGDINTYLLDASPIAPFDFHLTGNGGNITANNIIIDILRSNGRSTNSSLAVGGNGGIIRANSIKFKSNFNDSVIAINGGHHSGAGAATKAGLGGELYASEVVIQTITANGGNKTTGHSSVVTNNLLIPHGGKVIITNSCLFTIITAHGGNSTSNNKFSSAGNGGYISIRNAYGSIVGANGGSQTVTTGDAIGGSGGRVVILNGTLIDDASDILEFVNGEPVSSHNNGGAVSCFGGNATGGTAVGGVALLADLSNFNGSISFQDGTNSSSSTIPSFIFLSGTCYINNITTSNRTSYVRITSGESGFCTLKLKSLSGVSSLHQPTTFTPTGTITTLLDNSIFLTSGASSIWRRIESSIIPII